MSDIPPSQPQSQRLLHDLVANSQKHGLVVFVGSGINGKAVLQWGALLERLIRKSLGAASWEDDRIEAFSGHWEADVWEDGPLENWCRANFDVCALASIAKGILGPERFRLEIQDVLYESITEVQKDLRRFCRRPSLTGARTARFEFLRIVAQLCSLPQVRAVATFNYDTLLETAVRAVGPKIPWSYYGKTGSMPPLETSSQQMFPVFHLHGLLSSPDTLLRDSEQSAVLAYDEYFDKNADPLSWETASPIHLLRNFCTLWLGASLKDWNMLRLLHAARSAGGAPPSYCMLCLEEVRREFAFQAPRPEADKHKRNEDKFLKQCRDFYAAWDGFDHDEADFQRVAMRLQATLLERVGARLIVAGDRFSDIPKTIQRAVIKPLRVRTSARRLRNRKGMTL